jgi:hypothetical protein
MTAPRWLTGLFAVLLAATSGAALLAQDDAERERPSLSLRATPPVGFTPLNVRVVAELEGGSDDHPDYYGPAVEWDWGDGTRSESARDCEPYVSGQSEITRRYSATHTYRTGGSFRLRFRLRQGDDIVENGDVRLQVRRGTQQF